MSEVLAIAAPRVASPWQRLTGALAGDRLLAQLGTMGAAELVNRATRILTAIVLAHTLAPVEFGIAAIALTSAELIRILTATGLGARIVQCSRDELAAVCRSAYRLNWILHIGILVLQLLAALPIAAAYGRDEIGWLLIVLAVPYLIYPFAAVQVYLVQREQRTRATAAMLMAQISLDNLLTAALAIGGAGLWSVALPKLVVAVVWVVGYRRLCDWRPVGKVAAQALRGTYRFGAMVLATEIVNVLRLNADKLVIGQVAGLELLGHYYFAYNAGLGILTGLITAFGMALLPYLARSGDGGFAANQLWKPSLIVTAVTAPLIALQVALAPVYVPLVFGAQWAETVPLVMVLCASGLSLGLWRVLTQLLRARGRLLLELAVTLVYSAATILAIAVAAPYGLMAVGYAVLASSLIVTPLLALFIVRRLGRAVAGVPA